MFRMAILFLFLIAAVTSFARGDPLKTIDLASTNDWTCKRETESDWKAVTIPNQLSVKNTSDKWIDYRRMVDVPDGIPDRDTTIRLTSINDGGEIYIGDQKAGTVNYGLFPAEVHIGYLIGTQKHFQLTIRCFSRNHYYRGGTFPQDHNGEELLGIPRGVCLDVYPGVHVSDCFVISSVKNQHITVELWLSNQSSTPRTVDIKSALRCASRNRNFTYPEFSVPRVTLAPMSETKIVLGPVPWQLGERSYWWPNIPFDENYKATLHLLDVGLAEGDKPVDSFTRRFGFVEAGEGPNYYTINGVRIFEFQDGTQEHLWSPGGDDGFQRSYEQLPGWVTGDGGATETWKKYLRLGINCFRLHSSAGSESMLDAADESGFMIVGESGIRGYAKPEEEWDPLYKTAAVAAMARTYRSHPSVVRYSLDNEWAEATRNVDIAAGLIDATIAEDPTRPMSFSQDKTPWVQELFGSDKTHHAWVMDHYHFPTTAPDKIAGIEEDYWDRNGTNRNELLQCCRAAILDRLAELAVFSPWTLNNYWCNFVLGGAKNSGTVNSKWRNKDRVDGIDGWNSDLIRFMQNCYSIYASADVDLIKNHLNNESLIFDPARAVVLKSDTQITRQLVAFNNSLSEHAVSVGWELRWDRPDGDLVDSGSTEPTPVSPGGHISPVISFRCPAVGSKVRTVYFPLKTIVDGEVAFNESRYFFKIADSAMTQSNTPLPRSK